MSFETVISWVIGWIIGTVIMRVYYAFRNNQRHPRIHPLIPEHYTLPAGHSIYLQQRVAEHGVYHVLSCENEEGEEYLSIKSADLIELLAIKNKMESKCTR